MSRGQNWLDPYRCGWFQYLNQNDSDVVLSSDIESINITVDYLVLTNSSSVPSSENGLPAVDDLIASQHARLNEAFAADNLAEAAGTTPREFTSVAAPDTRIRFEMGNVTKIATDTSRIPNHVRSAIRYITRFLRTDEFPSGYYTFDNTRVTVIVTDSVDINNPPLSQAVLPNLVTSLYPQQVILISHLVFGDYRSLGADPPLKDYGNGNILVHEMGHSLGLFHPFHNGCTLEDLGATCLTGSSSSSSQTAGGGTVTNHFCRDVPPTSLPLFDIFNRGLDMTSCDSSTPIMTNNLMEYNVGDSLTAFTLEQASMMHYNIDRAIRGTYESNLKNVTTITRYEDGMARPFTSKITTCLCQEEEEEEEGNGMDLLCVCVGGAAATEPKQEEGEQQVFVVINELTLEQIFTSLVVVLSDTMENVGDAIVNSTENEAIEGIFFSGENQLLIQDDESGMVIYNREFFYDLFHDDYFSTIPSSSNVKNVEIGFDVNEYAERTYECFVDAFTNEINIRGLQFFIDIFIRANPIQQVRHIFRVFCQCDSRVNMGIVVTGNNSFGTNYPDAGCFIPVIPAPASEPAFAEQWLVFAAEYNGYFMWRYEPRFADDPVPWIFIGGSRDGATSTAFITDSYRETIKSSPDDEPPVSSVVYDQARTIWTLQNSTMAMTRSSLANWKHNIANFRRSRHPKNTNGAYRDFMDAAIRDLFLQEDGDDEITAPRKGTEKRNT